MPASLRIAQVCPYDLSRFGGVRSHILGLGEALVARGHQVTVLAPGHDGLPISVLGSLPVQRCGRVRPIDFSGTRIDLAWASATERRQALAPGFDVLHLHTPWNPAIPLQLATAFGGVRVATFHDVPGEATPWWARTLMPMGAAIIRRLLLQATIGVSPAVSAYLGVGTHVVIPNGVDDGVDDSAGLVDCGADVPVHGENERPIVYLGRLEPRKDVGTLLEAMGHVEHQLGTATPPLVIAGDGPMRAALMAQAAAHGVRRIAFCGAVTEEEKWSLLRRARCVVAPSRAGESFGIILLEAMRAGTVPIAADNPGYRHVVSPGGESLLFPPGDATILAERVVRMVQDSTWSATMQRWCAQRWPRFGWSRIAEEVERVYLHALGEVRR